MISCFKGKDTPFFLPELLNVFIRQKAEIESLKAERDNYKEWYFSTVEENEQLSKDLAKTADCEYCKHNCPDAVDGCSNSNTCKDGSLWEWRGVIKKSKFITNTEYYGGYAYIKTGFSNDTHQYKIVNAIQSNFYCDVPIKFNSEPYAHKTLEPVLNVIHCGIDETKVVRVAIKDCDKVIPPTAVKCEKWADAYMSNVKYHRCTGCGEYVEDVCFGAFVYKYCPNCGARMEGGE